MSSFCLTTDVTSFDRSAKYLSATPDAPDFDLEIGFVSDEIDMYIRRAYPGLTSTDLEDTTQLKLVCVHGVLAMLYRSAILARGSGAQYAAEMHRKEFEALLKVRIDLLNGETVSLGEVRVARG